MEALFLKLLDMGVSASWLILAVIAARFLLRNAPKSVRCILWALVALRLTCPVTIPSPFSLAPQAPAVEQILTAREIPIPTPVSGNRNNTTLNNISVETPKPESASASLRLTEIFSAVWLAGLSAMLLYALAGFLRLRRTVFASLSIGGNLWICDDIPAPFILGILRPRVYLPSNLDEAQARYVIAHENAHLRHFDHFWKPLGYGLLSVYWFHPLVWAAYVLFCRDLELACDERVVREMKLSERAAYSQALLDCSRERGSVAACPLAFGETGVKTRVKAVLNYRKPAFWIVIVSVIVCAVVAACFLTSPPVIQDNISDSGSSVSIDPADYGITEAMLSAEDMPDFYALSLEALGAYLLHTDGAGAEGSGDELYQRFMSDPDAVLHYLASLGGQKARGEDTAAAELCREIVSADVFWYGQTPEFTEILNEYSALYPDGPIAALLEILETEYGAAVERGPARVLSPDGLGVSDNGNDGAARLVAEMPVLGGKLKQVELRIHHDFRGYDTLHELLMAPTGRDLGIDSGYVLYRGDFPPENVVYDSETKTVAFQADGRSFVYDARSWI